jgi:biopolymer transport protein ExbD
MMTPLIDVIFLLMIFFIMTLNFLVPEGILENRLPDQARTAKYEREKDWEVVKIHVARGREGPQIYLQERRVAGLGDLLLNLHRLPRDVIVVIEPEAKVAYKHVISVFNTCIKAKKTNISFTIPRMSTAQSGD